MWLRDSQKTSWVLFAGMWALSRLKRVFSWVCVHTCKFLKLLASAHDSKWITRNKQMPLILLTFLLIPIDIYIYNIYTQHRQLLLTKTMNILHKQFNGHLNLFVLACSSTHAWTWMRGWRMRECWSCNPLFFLILPLYSFISLLPGGEVFSFFAC